MIKEIFSYSAKIKNFKCFGEEEQGFDRICPINLIIGRNNSGKSSLIDLIIALIEDNIEFPVKLWYKDCRPDIILESPLTESQLKQVFPENFSGGGIPANNYWEYGKRYVNCRFKWSFCNKNYIHLEDPPGIPIPIKNVQNGNEYLIKLVRAIGILFRNLIFIKLSAERGIIPEKDDEKNLLLKSNGQGSTNIIQNFINKANLSSDLVEKVILSELNKIFNPDTRFTDIVCQQLSDGCWEIYLEEETKGRVPLSESGSGIKTIILVLISLYLIPVIKKQDLNSYVFAFEELENNLHPALLRRLLNYLYDKYKENGCIFFLTTHSNVVIDQFSTCKDAQIIHVTHDGEKATCNTVKTYFERASILDDIDVRASDLLQANGIIWLEGPSDRIYLNRWIDLYSNGQWKEGTHYQCVFYGGKLLSHLSADDPNIVEDEISILSINRNSIIILDSDRDGKKTPLNKTKIRIIEEMRKYDGFVWITQGREIENYIPAQIVVKIIEKEGIKQVSQYENFFKYLDKIKDKIGVYYSGNKPLLAEKASSYFTIESMKGILDLGEKIDLVCKKIEEWNS